VGLLNCPERSFTTYGAWKLGTVLPIRWDLPLWEDERLVNLANPTKMIPRWGP